MNKLIVKELIQDDLTAENVINELNKILHETENIDRIKKEYAELKNKLQQYGNASEKAALIITGYMQKPI